MVVDKEKCTDSGLRFSEIVDEVITNTSPDKNELPNEYCSLETANDSMNSPQ